MFPKPDKPLWSTFAASPRPGEPVVAPSWQKLNPRQKRELGMWETWNNGGKKPDDLKPLLTSLKPLINKEASKWSRSHDVPAAAIKGEFLRHAVDALVNYDPSLAKMNTHLKHRMRKAQRFVTTYQNPARIPERRTYRITEFTTARDELDEEFGRPPSSQELADHMGWSIAEASRMQSEIIRADPMSKSVGDSITNTTTANAEAVRLMYYDLPEGPERVAYEYTFGLNGKPTMRPGEVAKKLKMSPSKVSRLRKKYGKMLVEYGAE